MANSVAHPTLIRSLLIDWFNHYGKTYPWRTTVDPWYILVSEIMLQQTTIPTVLKRYEAWMAQFPTPAHLAQVDEETALLSWEGLGYYRRVRSLQHIAQEILSKYEGRFPNSQQEIMALPGIGAYTCGAILSFAFNKPAPIVDTNVARVIARLDHHTESLDCASSKKYMWERSSQLVDPINPRAFNSAIMELGQTYCKPQIANCLLCPLQTCCLSTLDHPLDIPVKPKKTPASALKHYDIVHIKDDNILLVKQTGGRHKGMYRLPQRKQEQIANLPLLFKQQYSVTRYKVTRCIHLAITNSYEDNLEQFVPIATLKQLPMASPDRKALNAPAIKTLLNL